jgi:glycosyltransferase involved in cell wall biosynthesis
MKIILVAWEFPPVNSIAAVRLGKLARFLAAAGHDLRVVTAERAVQDRSLTVEIGDECIIRTPAIDVDRLFDRRPRGSSPAGQPSSDHRPDLPARNAHPSRSRAFLRDLYQGLLFFPDRRVGWGYHLVPALLRLLREFHPDVVICSGPPFSPLLWTAIATRIARVPWIAELRDRWADDTYLGPPTWRRPLDRWLERRVIGRASAIVTVSEPWRAFYEAKYRLPTVAVMNGYDPADFGELTAHAATPLPLNILHVGTIYRERRDPRPLFQALIQGKFTPNEIRIAFYGADLTWIEELAAEFGVGDFVDLQRPVPYKAALQLQSSADLLLLLQWNAPSEVGNVPGKLFEYLAVGRPILGLGPEEGVPAKIIGERGAGRFTNSPEAIAQFLRTLVEEKRRDGQVAAVPLQARLGFTRNEQFARFQDLLESLVAAPTTSPRQPSFSGSAGHPAMPRHILRSRLLSSWHTRLSKAVLIVKHGSRYD